MNSNYNYSDFAGIRLSANNELDYRESQQDSLQVVPRAQEVATEQRIEQMLFCHSKYYIYCE